MDKGIDSMEVQELIGKHHVHIGTFYDCSSEMYRGLGNLCIQDPRFTAFYEKIKPGLARFMHDAIMYYCDMKKR